MSRRSPAGREGVTEILGTFLRTKGAGESALMAFLMAGDPGLTEGVSLLEAASDGGADLLEVGWPFSDPIADGPTLQASAHRALLVGTGPQEVLDTCRMAGERTGKPIVLLSYLNPLLALGSFTPLREAGIGAVVIPDLSLEESQPIRQEMRTMGISLVPFAAPTSGAGRLKAVAEMAGQEAFVYCVALTGVTGGRQVLSSRAPQLLREARQFIQAPLVLGFGISSPDAVRSVAPLADGVIVGSALVDRHARRGVDGPEAVRGFVKELKAATTRG